mmetsp:Transcript_588/g.1355  ORF Transcript_588/g.1355 Transcript_588/m.1355 type:complete len:257 (-) Transcript_588:172-942(-)|eukprot:CAMPEP_0170596280 /NCGR_PEP_ID=MMETSP0224-20130122/15024_1 /TAXON_ID=285029 /ORGANISM="Togula jolla, Strain CCCM 725" /LENGTH=256 /DNA_ID=CAMNT_0010920543 /DNA_START=36 /DNA_END=806 /DNA_ORIENTATION=+
MGAIGHRSVVLGGLTSSTAVLALAFLWHEVRARQRAEQLAEGRFRLTRLVMRMLSEPLPREAEAAYLFHQMDHNVESNVAAADELVGKLPSLKILILDVEGEKLKGPLQHGFGGKPLLEQKLLSKGIQRRQMEFLPFDYSSGSYVNTLVEAQLVVQHAKAMGWRRLVVAAPSFHLPRAAMTTASVARVQYPELEVYPFVGAALPWEGQALHSQGMQGSRLDFLSSELERIEKYTAKGDIAPSEILEQYFIQQATAS